MSRLAVLCLLLLASAAAQDASTGTIRGTVSDAASARIPNATVALVNVATGIRYFATADSEGRFALALLPPGDYLARAEAAGMSPQITPACISISAAPVKWNSNSPSPA